MIPSSETKIKLVTYYTKSHESLFNLLKQSQIQEYELVVGVGPQICESGEYRSLNWQNVTLCKLQFIIEQMLPLNDEVFIYCDSDVVWLRPSEKIILDEFGDLDFVAQNDGPSNLCTGLFACRRNAAVYTLFKAAESRIIAMNDPKWDDQIALNAELPKHPIKWACLSDKFANKLNLPRISQDMPIVLRHDMVAYHANWCVGVEEKLKRMKAALVC